jgi:hypothetical protein
MTASPTTYHLRIMRRQTFDACHHVLNSQDCIDKNLWSGLRLHFRFLPLPLPLPLILDPRRPVSFHPLTRRSHAIDKRTMNPGSLTPGAPGMACIRNFSQSSACDCLLTTGLSWSNQRFGSTAKLSRGVLQHHWHKIIFPFHLQQVGLVLDSSIMR